ncbi:MAG: T9SS type A sorting domain-containing protein [Bacteroidota bacterium]|nr:T9SS type A sorting domain-containing protein [Bacteroidota bacterium]
MKNFKTLILIICVVLFSNTIFAQVLNDYRSNGTGNWSNAGIWERYTGTAWVGASTAPTGSGTITVQTADSVFINALVTITGTLKNQGKLGGTGSLTIASGGTYSHDQIAGSIPVCTWATGSTCRVTGYTTGSKPNNSNQNFHNFVWDCTGQTANIDVAWTGNIIGGDIRILSTGTARLQMAAPATYTDPITINGNIFVSGGQFASNGSSSAATITVTTKGNITVTGGNFSVSRGSGPDVTWNLWGNFSVSNAVLQNSGAFPKINKLVFAGTTPQTISLENVTYGTGTSHFTMEVKGGSTVDIGTNVINSSNTGSFLLLDGAALRTAHPGGISGSIQCTGASSGGGNSFSSSANYFFNGSDQQVTSASMPATVKDLTINNTGGVALSQPTTVNGILYLTSGVLDNCINNVTVPAANIVIGTGSYLCTPNSVEIIDGIPQSFYVEQNYPNPFNPLTTIKYGLPTESFVTVKVFNLLGQEVAELFDGRQNAGVHELNFGASNIVSGVYFYRIQTDKTVEVKQMLLLR